MGRRSRVGTLDDVDTKPISPEDSEILELISNLINNEDEDMDLTEKWCDPYFNKPDLLNFRYDHDLGDLYEDIRGRSVLFIAAAFQKYNIGMLMADSFPKLIHECPRDNNHTSKDDSSSRKPSFLNKLSKWWTGQESTVYPKHPYEGLKPFHLLVAFADTSYVKRMLMLDVEGTLLQSEARGLWLEGTLFSGKLPLSIAALTNNKKMVQLLLSEGADIFAQNSHGDTVLHSLVKFANCFPSKENNVVDMLIYLLTEKDDDQDVLETDNKNTVKQTDYHLNLHKFITSKMIKVMRMRNKQNKTVLQLAVEFGLILTYRLLMEANKKINQHDLAYEIRRYDVTEIDKAALVAIRRKDSFSMYEQSVSELICSQTLSNATLMVDNECIEEVIRIKWARYKWYVAGSGIFHFMTLCLLCVYAAAKSATIEGNGWASDQFIFFATIMSTIVGITYLSSQIILQTIISRQPLALTAVHHNSVFRVSMVLFSASLLIDSIINLVNGVTSNTFLVFAILPGSWFQLCFLRCIPYLGTFIVLINHALMFGLLPMAILIFFQVSVFSDMFFSLFNLPEMSNITNIPSDFQTYGKSFLIMAKVMVGLDDVDNLLDSREDVLVLFLYGVYFIIVSLLMINALISIMTNQFKPNYENRIQIVYLQRLSLSIFLEGFLFPFMSKFVINTGHEVGETNEHRVKGFLQWQEWAKDRCILSFRKVRYYEHVRPSSIEQETRCQYKSLRQQFSECTAIMESLITNMSEIKISLPPRKDHPVYHHYDRDSEDDYFSRDTVSAETVNHAITEESNKQMQLPDDQDLSENFPIQNETVQKQEAVYHPYEQDSEGDYFLHTGVVVERNNQAVAEERGIGQSPIPENQDMFQTPSFKEQHASLQYFLHTGMELPTSSQPQPQSQQGT